MGKFRGVYDLKGRTDKTSRRFTQIDADQMKRETLAQFYNSDLRYLRKSAAKIPPCGDLLTNNHGGRYRPPPRPALADHEAAMLMRVATPH